MVPAVGRLFLQDHAALISSLLSYSSPKVEATMPNFLPFTLCTIDPFQLKLQEQS
jgi:hypothetical protein